MIKIEVKSGTATDRTVQGKNGPVTFREQEAWAHLCDRDGNPQPYPQQIVVNLDIRNNQPPYPPGTYQLDPSSVFVNRFKTLTFGQVKLRPLAAAAPKAA